MEFPNPIHVLIQAIIFLALVVVFSRLVFRPILRVFEEREKRMSGDREEAKKLVKQADSRVQEYEEKIYSAKSEAKEIKTKLLQEAGLKEREILSNARLKASDIIFQARENLHKESKAMMPQIKRDAESIAKEMARLVLGREV